MLTLKAGIQSATNFANLPQIILTATNFFLPQILNLNFKKFLHFYWISIFWAKKNFFLWFSKIEFLPKKKISNTNFLIKKFRKKKFFVVKIAFLWSNKIFEKKNFLDFSKGVHQVVFKKCRTIKTQNFAWNFFWNLFSKLIFERSTKRCFPKMS